MSISIVQQLSKIKQHRPLNSKIGKQKQNCRTPTQLHKKEQYSNIQIDESERGGLGKLQREKNPKFEPFEHQISMKNTKS
jgi:hypothetical protein